MLSDQSFDVLGMALSYRGLIDSDTERDEMNLHAERWNLRRDLSMRIYASQASIRQTFRLQTSIELSGHRLS